MTITVGVLRGGPSEEHQVSIESGQAVLDNLPKRYRGVDIMINQQGVWLVDNEPMDPRKILPRFDVLFNSLHGRYGEDGEVQKLLRGNHYTGSGQLAAALSMDKLASKQLLEKEVGIQTPLHCRVRAREDRRQSIEQILRLLGLPVIIKPNAGGSSRGVTLVRDRTELETVIDVTLEQTPIAVAEQYIIGREASCGVVDDLRAHDFYPLPPVEILPPPGRPFFDHQAKSQGQSEEICPGRFSQAEKAELQRLAVEAHRVLGLRHYSRTDFVIHPQTGIYYLETNSLPGLTRNSLLPQSLEAVGVSLSQFIDHVLRQALKQS